MLMGHTRCYLKEKKKYRFGRERRTERGRGEEELGTRPVESRGLQGAVLKGGFWVAEWHGGRCNSCLANTQRVFSKERPVSVILWVRLRFSWRGCLTERAQGQAGARPSCPVRSCEG